MYDWLLRLKQLRVHRTAAIVALANLANQMEQPTLRTDHDAPQVRVALDDVHPQPRYGTVRKLVQIFQVLNLLLIELRRSLNKHLVYISVRSSEQDFSRRGRRQRGIPGNTFDGDTP
jgi:hypothetical protein